MLKINIGFNRKVGEANYGSRGAMAHLEVEAETALLRQPDRLREKIEYLFALAEQAVDAQLYGPRRPPADPSPDDATCPPENGLESAPAAGVRGPAGPRPAGASSNGQSRGGRVASDKQRRFAQRLARQIPGLDAPRLDALSGRLFDKPLAQLNSAEASGLIETLSAIRQGQRSLESALSPAAAS